jgi:hypothetical protein
MDSRQPLGLNNCLKSKHLHLAFPMLFPFHEMLTAAQATQNDRRQIWKYSQRGLEVPNTPPTMLPKSFSPKPSTPN